MMRITILAGLCCLFSSPLMAQSATDNDPEIGEQTRYWLNWQSSGEAASSQPQTLSGPVADRIFQRYQDSFSYSIPEYFSGDDGDASVLGE